MQSIHVTGAFHAYSWTALCTWTTISAVHRFSCTNRHPVQTPNTYEQEPGLATTLPYGPDISLHSSAIELYRAFEDGDATAQAENNGSMLGTQPVGNPWIWSLSMIPKQRGLKVQVGSRCSTAQFPLMREWTISLKATVCCRVYYKWQIILFHGS